MKETNYNLEREDIVHFVVRKLGFNVDNIIKLDCEDLTNVYGVHISNKSGCEASLLLGLDRCEVCIEKGSTDKDIKKIWQRHVYSTLNYGDFKNLFDVDELTK